LPPLDVVNRYWQRFDKLEPPQVVMNMAEGLEYILKQQNVFFDPESRKYIHGGTRKVIYGYKSLI
jgi:hypothetical protein